MQDRFIKIFKFGTLRRHRLFQAVEKSCLNKYEKLEFRDLKQRNKYFSLNFHQNMDKELYMSF